MEKMAGKYSFVSQDKFKDWLKAEGKPLDSVLYFRINFVLSKIYIYIYSKFYGKVGVHVISWFLLKKLRSILRF